MSPANAVARCIRYIGTLDYHSVTMILSEKLKVQVTRRHSTKTKRPFRGKDENFVVTVGPLNYAQRQKLRQAKRAGMRRPEMICKV